jgi:8-oxo-dGTP pyrophosphatase MutT (NUDIX family)
MLYCANFILYDRGHRLLLQHRTRDADRLPDFWAFFGGQIENDETPCQAVLREALEELNYRLVSPRPVFEQEFRLDQMVGHMTVFLDTFNGDPSDLELKEGQGLGWFTAPETEMLKMIEHDRRVIRIVDELIQPRRG